MGLRIRLFSKFKILILYILSVQDRIGARVEHWIGAEIQEGIRTNFGADGVENFREKRVED